MQRVLRASVSVDSQIVGECPAGLCALVAVHRDDTELNVKKMAEKLINLRIFNDPSGKMNLSLLDVRTAGASVGILAVSNFTVYGDASKSRRPSFTESAPYDRGQELFDELVDTLTLTGIPVGAGIFGADMQVEIVNDGPVTLVVEA